LILSTQNEKLGTHLKLLGFEHIGVVDFYLLEKFLLLTLKLNNFQKIITK